MADVCAALAPVPMAMRIQSYAHGIFTVAYFHLDGSSTGPHIFTVTLFIWTGVLGQSSFVGTCQMHTRRDALGSVRFSACPATHIHTHVCKWVCMRSPSIQPWSKLRPTTRNPQPQPLHQSDGRGRKGPGKMGTPHIVERLAIGHAQHVHAHGHMRTRIRTWAHAHGRMHAPGRS